ncbi:TonB-dependent receptor [Tamlana agarivorans]|uniref:TonB-dependent receptor n=1 Tax=Pseudotamlana agarivorans TaxID=481183 RepID=A0ACC5U9R5_9FLAO|nr:TonB-dependent receptor [Tamlana agarivorans]MBU2951015.1 TonB-dependent receptor [Tamlana agarivorans]
MKLNKLIKTEINSNIWSELIDKKHKYGILSLFICQAISPTPIFAATKSVDNGTPKKVEITQQTITGTVSDVDGPLPGASVMIKGTSTGTVTDFDGEFNISTTDSNATLVISYVGYITQEIKVGNQSNINILLEPDTAALDEVVVVGYTTRKKGEITGSVSTVNSESIEKSGSKDLAKSLSGKVPGMIISDRGGYPGSTGDVDILIRGKATLNNNNPLILIDGVPAESFSYLSPQDIESLSVLKDGAAAIYGARAANGVILITTKRGKSGKPKINFNSTYNVSKFSVEPKFMNSEQYAIYNNEIAERYGQALPYSQADIDKYAAGNDPFYPSTDWSDLTFANSSPEARNSLSISGGSENVNYFVGADAISQVGMFHSGDLNFKQNQIRSNLDIKIVENFKIGVDLSGRFGTNKEPGVDANYIYKHIYTNLPTEVGIYPNGLVAWGGENGSNPYIMSTSESGFVENDNNDLRGRFSYDINLNNWIKGLELKGFASVQKESYDEKSWYTPWEVYTYQEGTGDYIEEPGYSQQGNKSILRETYWEMNNTLFNATIHYRNMFAEKHTVSGFVGMEQATTNQRTFWAERRDFPSDNHPELFAGSDEGQISYGTSQEWARLNFFGSLSYDFKKKYFVDFTIRRDGSSNFGEGNRFGTFPGVAASWAIDKEGFMDNANWINALRLRTSWALMGNDRIDAFQYLTRYSYGGPTNAAQPNYYIFGTNGSRQNGYTSTNVPNPDITWETADMKNIGLNMSLFDGRFNADFNYFYQKRENILITRNASIPEAAGLTLPEENLGKVDNFGWEAEASWSASVNENFHYNIGGNFTQAKNEVVYLDEAADVPEGLKQEGHPMDSYIVYPTNGLFRDQDEVNAAPAKLDGTVEGEPYYVDTDGNGVIDANDRTRAYTSATPEIQYGVFGGFTYKNLDFSFLFQGQAKAETLVFFDQAGARPEFVYNDRWTPDNRDASYPRAFGQSDEYSGNQSGDQENFEGADLYLKDASFLRLKEIELGYTLTKEKSTFADIRFFVRGFNLFTMFSDIADANLDPEALGYNNFRGSTYPSLKTFTLGLNLNF